MNRQSGQISMRYLGTLLVGLALGVGLAWWLFQGSVEQKPVNPAATDASAESGQPKRAEREILYWVEPMDPNYRRDKPGKSPMGMDLVPVYADETVDDSDSLTITPTVEHNLGVRMQAAEIRPLWRRIEATGYVGLDENLLSHVHLRTEGWIERLLVHTEGERVRKGQLLFEYYSPDVLNAQKEYLQATRRGEQKLSEAAQEKLRALGMLSSEIAELAEKGETRQAIGVVAPANGVITTLNVRHGTYVRPEDEVMSLADLSTVWMQAEIFESQADWVKPGQSAEARLDYLPGEVFAGQVDYVYPVLDPDSRTLRVRLRFENPEERLKPNMYASVTIYGSTHQDALTIPRDAVIRAAGSDRVVVALGEGRYRVHEVMTGIESGEWVEIIAGIEAGDEVVTSAQFLIDSEASLTGSLRRLEGADSDDSHRNQAVFGSGIVESLDLAERHMTIRHGPIDALGWPAMTMEFAATTAVDLARIQPGQSVHFSIRPEGTGVYVVDMVHLVDQAEAGGEQHDDGVSPHD